MSDPGDVRGSCLTPLPRPLLRINARQVPFLPLAAHSSGEGATICRYCPLPCSGFGDSRTASSNKPVTCLTLGESSDRGRGGHDASHSHPRFLQPHGCAASSRTLNTGEPPVVHRPPQCFLLPDGSIRIDRPSTSPRTNRNKRPVATGQGRVTVSPIPIIGHRRHAEDQRNRKVKSASSSHCLPLFPQPGDAHVVWPCMLLMQPLSCAGRPIDRTHETNCPIVQHCCQT